MPTREEWRAKYGTPEYRLYRTARRYGMTVDQLKGMLERQYYECLICSLTIDETSLRVDHDPECCENSAKSNTCGKCTRGLLCHRCNLNVGHLENMIYDNLFDKTYGYVQFMGENPAKNDPEYDPNKPLKS